MGGAVVQEIACSPGRLLSLTLEDTGYRFSFSRNAAVAAFIAMRHQLAEEQGMAAVASRRPGRHRTCRLSVATRSPRGSRACRSMGSSARRGLEGWDGTTARAAGIVAPTLMIYGDLDAPALVAASLRLAELIPNASSEVIPEAAHSPQWERPELFNRALRRHLEANESKS